MAYINLQTSHIQFNNYPLVDFTNTAQFAVRRIVHKIKVGKIDYIILEFSEDELSNPSADPIIIGVLKRNNGERLYKQYALWQNKVWNIIEPSTIQMLATLAGINIPLESESDRIKQLNEEVEKLNARTLVEFSKSEKKRDES